jgi:branched-chain amino acid transport system ATP-binding protein
MLEVENVNVFYGGVQALRGVSIMLESREIVTILGANGSGKSTLLKTISGVLHPKDGNIYFEGKNISRLPSYKVTGLGISQVPEGKMIFGPLSVLDNLILGSYTRNRRKEKAEIKNDLDLIYALFPNLKEKEKDKAQTLSGGQQQMLALGRALMSRPKILMTDEPSLGLAPLLVNEIITTIFRLNKMGLTILLVEQRATLALKFSNRAYIFENGIVKYSGMSADFLKNEEIRRAYLGG